jgi:type IV secretion system protein VirB8
VATISFRYTDADMSAADRLVNPLGFQVVRYRKDAEALPTVTNAPTTPSVISQSTTAAAPAQ